MGTIILILLIAAVGLVAYGWWRSRDGISLESRYEAAKTHVWAALTAIAAAGLGVWQAFTQ